MKTVRCDQNIFDVLHQIGIDRLLIPGEHRACGEYATCGIEAIVKYYLLNKVASELGLDIDPRIDASAIADVISEHRLKKAMTAMSEKMELVNSLGF